jgi:aryl-alcohol dehydrogenase-like predicted oxidoreductase
MVTHQMKKIEKEVNAQIMNSKNTSQLRSALSALHYKLNHKEMDRLHEQKNELDQRAD